MAGAVIAPDGTIPSVLERAAATHGDAPALADDRGALSYGELLAATRAAAAALVGAGLARGDRVAVWASNSVEWAVASLGVLFAGAVVVPINTRYTSVEAVDVIDRARCRIVVAEGRFLGRDLAAEAHTVAPDVPVVVLGDPGTTGVAWSSFTADGAAAEHVDERLRSLSPHDVSHIQYTSGTTGRPKGAMLQHDAMVQTTAAWVRTTGLCARDRYPIVAPFSHIGGHKTGLLATLIAGACAMPIPTLDVTRLGQLIDEWGVTFLQGPPTMFQSLIAAVRDGQPAPAHVRVGVTGAASIPPSLIHEMVEILGIDAVFTAYGLTETTGVCTMTSAVDGPDVVAGTSGRPLAGIDVRIVASDGTELAAGEPGEIVVRGVNVMRGYLDDPEASADAIRDGWLHTGDIGWLGDDGRLRIVDRLKDMIIVGGFNVYPAEIEAALLQREDVTQAAVVGVPDERMGEVPVAYLVPAPGHALRPDEIIGFCKERLANFKVPREIQVVDALPVNAAGKVLKRDLRETFISG